MLRVVINEGDTAEPGTALLIAAAPVGKGRLVDASSVLPTLAAVPPSALTGTPAATVVELADPLDPQTVLTRIRAAATAAGPLFLYIAGQLQLDRKQRLLHLALARTTPTTMRYTALPWHWLAAETAIRRPGTTTVVVDLVADADAWQHLASHGLGLGPGIRLYGRVCPAPRRSREAATPAYLKACAAIWRSGARPDPATLHEQAAARAGDEEALLLAIGTPRPYRPQGRPVLRSLARIRTRRFSPPPGPGGTRRPPPLPPPGSSGSCALTAPVRCRRSTGWKSGPISHGSLRIRPSAASCGWPRRRPG